MAQTTTVAAANKVSYSAEPRPSSAPVGSSHGRHCRIAAPATHGALLLVPFVTILNSPAQAGEAGQPIGCGCSSLQCRALATGFRCFSRRSTT